jgi:hypothetical protein
MKRKRSIFDIDLGNLHLEWAKQSKLYQKAAEALAEGRAKVDSAKSSMDVVEAELVLDISNDPKKYCLLRVNEWTIKACAKVQTVYRKAQKKHNRLKYEAGILQAAVDALEQKKKALEGEVSLFLSGYWSDPRLPKELRDSAAFDRAAKAEVRKKGQVRRK